MRILLAGGAGYIGSVLVPQLLDRGYQVEVIDLLWFGNALPPDVKVRRSDILELTEQDLAGFDHVVYLAGLSNDPMAEFSPARNFVSNAASPTYLAYLAKRAGVHRFVYASSCSIYGYSREDLCVEDGPTFSQYPYGISKLQGELGVLYLRDEQFSVIALRKGTVCGYSPRMRFDLVVNTMFKTAITTNTITVNNPAIWRPILAMQDATDAYVRAIEADDSISGVFNIASGNYTLGELGDYVGRELRDRLGIKPRLEIRHVPDIRNYKVNLDKAQHVLGFRPSGDVRGIVRELIEHQDWFGDMDDPNYYNIDVFKALEEAAPVSA